MWYDKWSRQGPLCDFISKRAIYEARLDDGMKISGMIGNGKWIWPQGWESRFPVLKDLDVPILNPDNEDKVVWLNNSNQTVEFSTKQAWSNLRGVWPSVVWKHVVWFKQFIPRHG